MQNLLQMTQSNRDIGEVKSIVRPEIAEMACGRSKQVQVEGLERHAARPQPVHEGSRYLEPVVHQQIRKLQHIVGLLNIACTFPRISGTSARAPGGSSPSPGYTPEMNDGQE